MSYGLCLLNFDLLQLYSCWFMGALEPTSSFSTAQEPIPFIEVSFPSPTVLAHKPRSFYKPSTDAAPVFVLIAVVGTAFLLHFFDFLHSTIISEFKVSLSEPSALSYVSPAPAGRKAECIILPKNWAHD